MTRVVVLQDGTNIALNDIGVAINSPLTGFLRVAVADAVPQLYFIQTASLKDLYLTEGVVSGTAPASTYSEGEASTVLNIGTSVGAYLQKTSNYPPYYPGNSFLGFLTFNFEGSGQANVNKDAGFFDPNNGIFLRMRNGTLYIVKRTKVSGTVVDTEIPQSQWNGSKFNSNDGIGYNFDPTMCHFLAVRWEWLGIGNIEVMLLAYGKLVVAHTFTHTNAIALPWASYGAFPIAVRIERLVAGGAADKIRSICGAVFSEGAVSGLNAKITLKFQATTSPFGVNSANFKTTGNQSNTWIPLIVFRINPDKANRLVYIQDYDLMITDNGVHVTEVMILRNPTFSAAYTFAGDDKPNTAVQYQTPFTSTPLAYTSLAVTNWDQEILPKMMNGAANSYTTAKESIEVDKTFPLGTKYDGTSYLYVLAVWSNQNSITIPYCHVYLKQFV